MATSLLARIARSDDYIGFFASQKFAEFVVINVAVDATKLKPIDPIVNAIPADTTDGGPRRRSGLRRSGVVNALIVGCGKGKRDNCLRHQGGHLSRPKCCSKTRARLRRHQEQAERRLWESRIRSP
jgi:hypothetical protein